MAIKKQPEAQNPLILRCNRLMEAFAKSDDERDFYLDHSEGFIIYVDLDKPDEELTVLEKELEKNKERYSIIPKLTFYESKKIMEGFVIEKVYDIDTKEKLLDIIQSKEARENFLDFIYDHHSELEKWQAFYQERSRIRIIEWLRGNNFHFVFEEDLELPRLTLEKLKKDLFQPKVGKELQNARKILFAKAKTYYSNEALNPRPKRGRPPKQIQKIEIESQITTDIYTTVPPGLSGFLFIPDLQNAASASFSSKFGTESDVFSTKHSAQSDHDLSMETLNQKLEVLRTMSTKWREAEEAKTQKNYVQPIKPLAFDFDDDKDDDDFIKTKKIKAKVKLEPKKTLLKSDLKAELKGKKLKTAPIKPNKAVPVTEKKASPTLKAKSSLKTEVKKIKEVKLKKKIEATPSKKKRPLQVQKKKK